MTQREYWRWAVLYPAMIVLAIMLAVQFLVG